MLLLAATLTACGGKQAAHQNETTEAFSEGEFKLWAQTPPMGWNSWDCYGPTVVEEEVKANADYMAEHLKEFGWEYVVVDIRWFVENDKAGGYNETDARYVLDEWGRYMPAINRFPSAADGTGFKHLADYVHDKGLKFGIHIMRGIPKEAIRRQLPIKGTDGIKADQIYTTDGECKWLHDNYTIMDVPGGQEYYASIFELYAEWGLDFIKIDDLSAPYHQSEIDMIRYAIDHCGREIVLSTSPGETPIENAQHVSSHANMWRMVNDVWDLYTDLTHLMDVAEKWTPYIQDGTWPDCDMIPLGHIAIRGERGEDRMTRLTHDEQYSLMNFFTILRSPLMYGGDLPTMDEFTLQLLTNQEVLRMHRESENVRYICNCDDKVIITSNNRNTKEIYLAIFNRNDTEEQEIEIDMSIFGNRVSCVTNLWDNTTQEITGKKMVIQLKPHASVLLKMV